LTLVVPLSSNAQLIYEKTYGGVWGDVGYDVQKTQDGGFIITGYSNSFFPGGVYLVKTDSLGDTLWTNTYDGRTGYSVQVTTDGGYIIAGRHYTNPNQGDVYLVKTDSLGATLWTRTYGGNASDNGFSVKQTSDEGYIVVGSMYINGGDQEEVYLIKTDPFGDTLWTRTIGAYNSTDVGRSILLTSDGGYFIAGYTEYLTAGGLDVYLLKTDSLGNTLWTKTYGGASYDYGYSAQKTTDGGYIIVGYTNSFGPPGVNVYLVKTDSLGDTLWTGTYGGNSSDIGRSVQQTVPDGVYVITGYTWTYGGDNHDYGYSILQTVSDGGFVIVGATSSFSSMPGYTDVYLIKTGPNVDLSGPIPISAVASDNVNPVPGIDNDDQVMITFDEPTDKPIIDVSNIDAVLTLSGGHTWLDGFGVIGDAEWNPVGDKLLINLSTNFGPPTVAVGDIITPDGVTIHDIWGNPCVTSVIITGSFNPVGVEENVGFGLPKDFLLSQNYPNPFYNSTLIRYSIPITHPGSKILPASPSGGHHVSLNIYDISGRLVETLVDEVKKTGVYQLPITSYQLPSNGVYFYRLTAGDFTSTKKLILLR
jgi:hypothetical protein